MTSLRTPCLAALVLLTAPIPGQDKRAMTFEDVMRFKRITSPVIADPGTAVAYVAAPDRGDGEVLVHDLERDRVHRVERGSAPRFSKDGRWLGATVLPPAFAKGKDRPRPALALLDLQTGRVVQWQDVQRFAFADDSRHLAILHHPAEKDEKKNDSTKRTTGTRLLLRRLGMGEGAERSLEHVTAFAFHPEGRALLCAVATADGSGNGLFSFDLSGDSPVLHAIATRPRHLVTAMRWTESGERFAFAQAPQDDDGVLRAATIFAGRGNDLRVAAYPDDRGAGWTLPATPALRWEKEGAWLAFGFQPEAMAERLLQLARERNGEKAEEAGQPEPLDPYDRDRILAERGVDVWHWRDPLINSNQKKAWSRISGRTYTALWYPESGELVPLCDEQMPEVRLLDGSPVGLGSSDVPYRREITWDGRYRDYYVVDLRTGERTEMLRRQGGPVELSPDGEHLVFWRDGDWHHAFADNPHLQTRLTHGGFANEDHDYPSAVPGYGFAGWLQGGGFVLRDKFDLWRFAPPSIHREAFGDTEVIEATQEPPSCLTIDATGKKGRDSSRTFRVLSLDPEARYLDPQKPWLLASYHDRRKNHGFYRLVPGKGVRRLLEDDKKFSLIAKAGDADRILYSRESYTEFPDLWVASTDLRQPQRISDLGRQTEDYAWGTAELVEWRSIDGIPLQGVLIKPGNYRQGQRYPVLVYYYRFFSQRLHEFNQVVVNHRPCFPYYASNGYAVFLPDIRFDVGHPGYSATKCLVPGVQKLIDLGVADPEAIALHGHSWSGYQTAFVITQTDAFCCAIAGAPVSNMTSAYGGIRWQTGLSRQFQYEKTQSRIGGSLWEYPERYIENSPVFFADRIETPLLIQFGDEDGAVPWYQGIELYMAMRRLDKECVFLQYRGEPHHLQKYANKLDYSIRFKEWLDHYCKGLPAAEWIDKGVPYDGR